MRIVLVFAALLVGCGTPTPIFQVGDCIGIDIERERWETPVVTRVEEIGRAAYRMRFYLRETRKWADAASETTRFTDQWMYSKVPCP